MTSMISEVLTYAVSRTTTETQSAPETATLREYLRFLAAVLAIGSVMALLPFLAVVLVTLSVSGLDRIASLF